MARVRVQVPVDQPAMQQPSIQPPTSERRGSSRQLLTRNNIIFGLVTLVILIVMLSLLNDRKRLENKVNKLSTNQASSAQTDNQKYQDEVSKLVEVPAGVTPGVSVLTQESIKQLPNDNILQSSAKVGDVILLYKINGSDSFVVMYRPSSNRVILATASTSSNPTNATKP